MDAVKKVIIADFAHYDDKFNKLGNYHYANCFVKDGFEVLWMTSIFNKLIWLKDKEEYLYRKKLSMPKRHMLARNVFGFAPYSRRLYGNYPLSRNPEIVFNNERHIMPDIRKTLEKIGFINVDILWISDPKQYWLANVVNYKKLVFRIPDDYIQFPNYPASIAEIQDRLIDKADYIFVTSRALEEKAVTRGKKPYLLRNGVEFDHFKKDRYLYPDEYKKFRHKVIYIGAIKEWIDKELIKKAASNIDGDIFLIGKPQINLDDIEKYPSIHILGAVPYDNIPDYLHYADVAIIPFAKNKLTDAVNPIKLFEYCSAGIPVVCTNTDEIADLNAPVYIAKDHDDFIFGINNYIANKINRELLIDYGRKNSWQARFDYARQIIFKEQAK